MSDLRVLESARPFVQPLSDDERHWIHGQVFGDTPAATSHVRSAGTGAEEPDSPIGTPGSADRSGSDDVGADTLQVITAGDPAGVRRNRTLVAAAAAVAVLAAASFTLTQHDDHDRVSDVSTGSSPAAATPSPTGASGPATNPLDTGPDVTDPAAGIGEGGTDLRRPAPSSEWRLTNVIDQRDDRVIAIVALTERGLEGPLVRLETLGEFEGWTLPTSTEVDIGTSIGALSQDDTVTALEWTDASGRRLRAWSVDVPPEVIVDLATRISVDTDGHVTTNPTDATETVFDTVSFDEIGRAVEYQYTAVDGRELTINTYPGGANAQRSRIGGEDRITLVVDDETFAAADYGNGTYRANVVRGFWAWEITGVGFTSMQDLVDVAASIESTADANWQARLDPASGVLADGDRDEVIRSLLQDVPIPPTVQVDDLIENSRVQSRVFVIADLATTIVCAWADEWFTASGSGDNATAATAARALRSSKHWAMLNEIADQGGLDDEIWAWADAFNAPPGASTDPLHPLDPEALHSALGC